MNGKPGDERGFIHKKIFGGIKGLVGGRNWRDHKRATPHPAIRSQKFRRWVLWRGRRPQSDTAGRPCSDSGTRSPLRHHTAKKITTSLSI